MLKALSFYCNNEIEEFKNSELYTKLQKIVDEQNYVTNEKWGWLDDVKQWFNDL